VDLQIASGVVVTFARPAIMEIRQPLGAVDDGTDSGSAGGTGGRPADGTL
jgi:preprotein translocase subunit YajC